MVGEIYLGQARMGLEAAYGAPVPPTRRIYCAPGSGVVPGGSNIRHALQSGNRSQFRASSPGVSEPSGSFSLPTESGEVLEILSIGVDGSPVVTTPVGATTTRLHTYLGGVNAVKSATTQFHNGAHPWQLAGTYANTVRFAGSANGEVAVSGDLFGSALTQTPLSGAVTDRTTTPYGGWEGTLAIDSVSGTDNYGTTVIAAGESITNFDVLVAQNNLERLYTLANTRAMQAAIMGTYDATGSMAFVASGARALTEYNDFVAGTQKRLRLTLGNNAILEGALRSFITIDVQIVWTSFNLLGEEAGVRAYEAEWGYVHDAVSNFAARVRCQNARTAAFA